MSAVDLNLLDYLDLPDDELYAACRTNGSGRATRCQMEARYEALRRIIEEIQPCSVRQVFYQAEIRGIVEKTERGYDKVQRALVQLRQWEIVPYRSITDNTRWRIRPTTWDSLTTMIEESARAYRRSVWIDVPGYVEVWLEKDALAGVIHPMTNQYDVPLMVARGFSSLSFLHSSAVDIQALQVPAYVYHLGDHDPSGIAAAQAIERRLREYAPRAEIHFERLAVLPEQIVEWDLPTRPTKKSTHKGKFRGESVELDAINPHQLRALVREAIEQHIPTGHLDHLKVVEDSEREMLEMFALDACDGGDR